MTYFQDWVGGMNTPPTNDFDRMLLRARALSGQQKARVEGSRQDEPWAELLREVKANEARKQEAEAPRQYRTKDVPGPVRTEIGETLSRPDEERLKNVLGSLLRAQLSRLDPEGANRAAAAPYMDDLRRAR